jgi:hypothetical protein
VFSEESKSEKWIVTALEEYGYSRWTDDEHIIAPLSTLAKNIASRLTHTSYSQFKRAIAKGPFWRVRARETSLPAGSRMMQKFANLKDRMKKSIDWMALSGSVKHAFLLMAILLPQAVKSVPNRTESFDLTKLHCQIGAATPHDAEQTSSDLTNFDFEYWYAIGTDGDVSMQTLFQVEQLLYTSIDQSILWCTEIHDSAVTQSLDNENRKTQEDASKESAEVRRLGVVTFTPGVLDEFTECKCTGYVP